jgi:hypothetical protein
VCTDDGTVYDIVNVVPYIKKHGKHPVTGAPLQLGDLIRLNFHKNSGAQRCNAGGGRHKGYRGTVRTWAGVHCGCSSWNHWSQLSPHIHAAQCKGFVCTQRCLICYTSYL